MYTHTHLNTPEWYAVQSDFFGQLRVNARRDATRRLSIYRPSNRIRFDDRSRHHPRQLKRHGCAHTHTLGRMPWVYDWVWRRTAHVNRGVVLVHMCECVCRWRYARINIHKNKSTLSRRVMHTMLTENIIRHSAFICVFVIYSNDTKKTTSFVYSISIIIIMSTLW